MDADWKERLERWARDRELRLPDVLDRLHRSDFYEIARAQHLAGASDAVIWHLLDGASTGA